MVSVIVLRVCVCGSGFNPPLFSTSHCSVLFLEESRRVLSRETIGEREKHSRGRMMEIGDKQSASLGLDTEGKLCRYVWQ